MKSESKKQSNGNAAAIGALQLQPGDIFFRLDRLGRLLEWNDEAEKATGFTRAEVLMMPFAVVCPQRAGQPIDLRGVLSGHDFAGGYATQRRDGTELQLYLYATAAENGTEAICLARDVGEFWRNRESVRLSEERYRLLLEQSLDAVVVADSRGRILEANPAASELLGYEPDELTRLLLTDLLAADRAQDTAAGAIERLRRDGSLTDVFMMTARSGRKLAVEVRAVLAKVGEQEQILAIGRDVTQRLAADRELRASEEKYRAMVEGASDAVLLETMDGRILDVNVNASRLLGYTRDELLQLKDENLSPEEVRPLLATVRDAVLRTGSFRGEAVVRRKDGTLVTVGLSVSRIDLGGSAATVVLMQDISERVRAQRELRAEKDRAQLYLDVAGVIILALDASGRVTMLNRRGCEILGWAEAELLGRSWFDTCLPENERAGALEVFQGLAAGRSAGVEYHENTVLARTGTKRLIAWNNVVLRDSTGRFLGTLSSGEDITERRRAEERLRDSEEQYRTAMEAMHDAVHIVDRDLRILLGNRSLDEWCLRLGLEGGLVGRRLPEVFPFLPAKVWREYESVFETGQPLMTNEITELEGGAVHTETRKVPIREGGRVTRVMTIIHDATKQRLTLAALAASEGRYRALVEHMRDGVAAIDTEGRVTFVNEAVVVRSGFPREWWTVRKAEEIVSPEHRERFGAALKSALAGSTAELLELAYRNANGQLRQVEMDIIPLTEADRVVGAMTISRDVTDRKAAERAARESDAAYRSLFELNPDGVAVHQDGRVVMVNERGARLLGYENPAELVGMPIVEILHPEDRELAAARIRAAIAEGKWGPPVEERFRRRDGSYITAEVMASPFVWAGRPAVQVVARDISERKRLEASVAETAAHLTAVLGSLNQGVAVETEGRIAYANEAFAQVYGYELSELTGRPVAELIAPEDRGRISAYTAIRRTGGQAPASYEFTGLRKDGSKVLLHIRVTTYSHQQRVYTVGMVETVAERRAENAGGC
ncbi:MAG: PAS domain S-box protein [candidate division WOR-3 bacterium]